MEVFCLYEAEGEYFDISNPAHVTRGSIIIGQAQAVRIGYFVGSGCIGCEKALQQIEERGYATEYQSSGKTIYKIGVNISSETGTVSEWSIGQ